MKFIFCGGNLPLSVIIQGKTNSRWSHCAVVDPRDDQKVIEAIITVPFMQKGGVVNSELLHLSKYHKRIHLLDVPLPNEQAASEFIIEQIGKGYDYSGLCGAALRRSDWQNPHKWYCSELPAMACKVGGLDAIEYDFYRVVTPEVLYLPLYAKREKSVVIL